MDLLTGRTVILVAHLIISMQHGVVAEVVEAENQSRIAVKTASEETASNLDLASQVSATSDEDHQSGHFSSEDISLLQDSLEQIHKEVTAEGRNSTYIG